MLSLPVGLSVCPFNSPVGCLKFPIGFPWLSKMAFQLSLGCLGPLLTQSSLPAWSHQEPSHLSWSPLICLWLLLSQSSPPTKLPWEPSYLSGLSPSSTPWLSLSFPLELSPELHLPCYDRFCLFDIVHWITFCTIVSLYLSWSEYSDSSILVFLILV